MNVINIYVCASRVHTCEDLKNTTHNRSGKSPGQRPKTGVVKAQQVASDKKGSKIEGQLAMAKALHDGRIGL